MKSSKELFERAKKVMPGGVNSPVRAFKSVGENPLFIERASGNKIYDVEGREYIDLVGSWGPMILGHSYPKVISAVEDRIKKGLSFGACNELEVELAELISKNIPHCEMVRMVNSGTEATMSAIRVARGFTGREKIIKFRGCYHGHSDSLLVAAGSGGMTFGEPDSRGVTKGAAKDTLCADYNDISSVEELFSNNKGEIAAIIVEPVAANMGVIAPNEGFLKGLRDICDREGAVLIFDEVITGFRLSFGGAAEYYDVTPDISTFGKIIGGGMPVGAYCGRHEIMKNVSPLGKVYQAGTLSGNPVAMAAGIAQLTELLNHPEIYEYINDLGDYFASELRKITKHTVNQVGSLLCVFHREGDVNNYEDALKSDTEAFKKDFNMLLSKGIYTAPSQFEAMFLSNAFTREDVDYIVGVFKNTK